MKYRIMTIFTCAALFLAGCAGLPADDSASPVAIPQQNLPGAQWTEADYETLCDNYLRAAFYAGVTSTSWEDAMELDPDCFVFFYIFGHPDIDWPEEGFPADKVEAYAQAHFSVGVEHIRQSHMYDPDSGRYVCDGVGSPVDVRVIGTRQEGDQLSLTFEALSRRDDETAIWGGRLHLRLEEDGFRYTASEHWMDPEDYLLALQGEHALLLSSTKPVSQLSYRDFAECADALICSYLSEDDGWVLQRFDPETGQGAHMIVLSDREPLRVAASELPDNEFAVFFEGGVAFYGTGGVVLDRAFHDLPEPVRPVQWDKHNFPCPYDYAGGMWVWSSAEGLEILREGAQPVLLLANDSIAGQFPELAEDYGELVYSGPRFLCDNTMVAVQLYSDQAQCPVAVAVVDLGTGELAHTLRFVPPAMPKYPVADRYVATHGMIQDAQLMDALTGDITALPFVPFYDSFDYETLLVSDYDRPTPDGYNDFHLFLREFDDLEDRSRLLLWGEGDQGFAVAAVTEHYVIVKSAYANAFWLAVARYR